MNKIKHNFKLDDYYDLYCTRCKYNFNELIMQTNYNFRPTDFRYYTGTEYIDATFPCLSDEEIIIKELLE